MVDDELPCGARREETITIVARDYPVAWALVGVALENVGVEVLWVVRHGPRCRRRRVGPW